MTGNGQLDLVVTNQDTGDVRVITFSGNGIAGTPRSTRPGPARMRLPMTGRPTWCRRRERPARGRFTRGGPQGEASALETLVTNLGQAIAAEVARSVTESLCKFVT